MEYNEVLCKEKHRRLDEKIEVHERIDMMLQSQLVENAIDVSYRKSGKNTIPNQEFSNQTVMNTIRKLDEIENSVVEKTAPKKKAKKKTEEAANKTAEGAKSVGHRTEDEAKKAGEKVQGK